MLATDWSLFWFHSIWPYNGPLDFANQNLGVKGQFMTTIYHNPRCSKSRQTLALLRNKGVEPEIVLYLETPIDRATLIDLLDKLKLNAGQLVRRSEQDFKDRNLGRDGVDEEQLIAAMLEYPKLIERPIVVVGDSARLGRPPENVLEIIDV